MVELEEFSSSITHTHAHTHTHTHTHIVRLILPSEDILSMVASPHSSTQISLFSAQAETVMYTRAHTHTHTHSSTLIQFFFLIILSR